MLLVLQRRDARERFAFQELQGSAAARGDMGDLVGVAELLDGRRGVAAAHDRDGVAGRKRGRDAFGSDRELVDLEDASRAVPNHRTGLRNDRGECLGGDGADIDAFPIGRDLIAGNDLDFQLIDIRPERVAVHNDRIDWKHELCRRPSR